MILARQITTIRKLIFSPAGISIFEHAAVTVLMMITFAILIRKYGLDIVGLWVLMTAFINFAYVGDVWSRGLLSFMGEGRGANTPKVAASFASTNIITGAIGYFILISICGIGLYILVPHIFEDEYQDLVTATIPLMVFAYWLLASAGNFLQAFIGFGRPLFSCLQRVGGALLFLAMISMHEGDSGLASIFKAQIFQGLGMLSFGIMVYYGIVTRHIRHRIWDYHKLGDLVRFGTKMLSVGIVQSTSEPIVKLLVGHFGGIVIVAIFEVANRFVMGVRGLTLSVGAIIITYFARIASLEKTDKLVNIRQEYCMVSRLMLSGSLMMFALLFACAPFLEWLFFDTDTTQPEQEIFALILVTLGLAWLLNAITSTGYFMLVALRLSGQLFVSEIIRAIIITLGGFLMGKVIGFNGILIGMILGFAVSSFYLFWQVSKVLGLSWRVFFRQITADSKYIIIPIIWSLAFISLTILAPHDQEQITLMGMILFLIYYVIGPLGTLLLVLKFSQIKVLIHGIAALKP